MSNKDAYPFWCSSCKHDHAGGCAKPGEAVDVGMDAVKSLLEATARPVWPGLGDWMPQPEQGNITLVIGPDTSGSCPEPDCKYCGTGKYSGT